MTLQERIEQQKKEIETLKWRGVGKQVLAYAEGVLAGLELAEIYQA